jgi:plastocyanin
VRARPTPLALYVIAAALAAPGALLAAEEPQLAEQAQPGPAAPGESTAPAEQPPAEQPPVDQPTPETRADAAPTPPPAQAPAAPNQEQAARQTSEAQPSPKPAEPAKEEPAPVARASAASVTIKDFAFAPKSVTVNAGETVTWTNSGPTPHSATASDGSFDTGVFKKGQSRSHTFQEAGTFSYICTPHPFMKATVTVASKGGSAGGESGSTGSSGSGAGSAGATSGEGADTESGSSLPASGADAWVLALLGAGLLALGLLTRRRAGA